MAACSPRDLKKCVYNSYDRKASSSNINNVYQRLENLNVPISKLLDAIDLEADDNILLDLGTRGKRFPPVRAAAGGIMRKNIV